MADLGIAQALATATPRATGAEQPETRRVGGFGELVEQALARANGAQLEAEARAEEMARGDGDLVETMIALSRADTSLRMVLAVRNRALEAYQEVLRLQV